MMFWHVETLESLSLHRTLGNELYAGGAEVLFVRSDFCCMLQALRCHFCGVGIEALCTVLQRLFLSHCTLLAFSNFSIPSNLIFLVFFSSYKHVIFILQAQNKTKQSIILLQTIIIELYSYHNLSEIIAFITGNGPCVWKHQRLEKLLLAWNISLYFFKFASYPLKILRRKDFFFNTNILKLFTKLKPYNSFLSPATTWCIIIMTKHKYFP